jgi:hypothetical protein
LELLSLDQSASLPRDDGASGANVTEANDHRGPAGHREGRGDLVNIARPSRRRRELPPVGKTPTRPEGVNRRYKDNGENEKAPANGRGSLH